MEAGDLSVDEIQWGRDWSKASESVLFVDLHNIAGRARWKGQIALDSLEVGLEEEGSSEEGVVDI